MLRRAEFNSDPPEACPDPFNLVAHVLGPAASTPEKPALIVVDETGTIAYSYRELRARVLATATGLRKASLGRGDRVVLRLGNRPEFPITFLAAIAIGAIPVPTAAALTAGEFTALLVTLDRVSAIVTDDPLATTAPVLSSRDIAAMSRLPPSDIVPACPDDPAFMVFTSGSSGTPKAVVHAHRAVWARRMMWRDWYGLTDADRVLHAGAFNWTYTLGTGLMDPWAAGATAIICTHRPDRSAWPNLIRDLGVTIFAASPGIYRQILSADDLPLLPGLRHGLSAGEVLPTATRESWRERTGTPMLGALGMSECSTYISSSPNRAEPRPQAGRRIAILDDSGAIAAVDEVGELAVHRTDQGLMLGYHRNGARPDLPLSGDWFRTGDRASMDASGTVTHHGRVDDLITAGGYRIAPHEIEAALASMPGIDAVAATGLRTGTGATIVAAFYTGPAAIEDDTLRTYISDRLAPYKIPRAFIHLAELPTRANGKLDRKSLSQWTLP